MYLVLYLILEVLFSESIEKDFSFSYFSFRYRKNERALLPILKNDKLDNLLFSF